MEEFSGGEYLAIDIANQFGWDKELFNPRIEWVVEHDDELEDLEGFAEDSFRYSAAVMAYRDAQQGIATGHLVGMDACASGCQIMAAVTGCHITARNTGLIGDVRADLYGATTKVMNGMLDENVNYPRNDVKDAQMPYFYGSKAMPKAIFGEATVELVAFYEAQKLVAPGAVKLMDIMLGSWQAYAKNHSWPMPDGFEVVVPVMETIDKKIEVDELDGASFVYRYAENIGQETGLSIAANITHSLDGLVVRELCRRCNYDKDQLILVMQTIINHFGVQGHNYHVIATQTIECRRNESQFLSLVGIEHVNDDSVHLFSADYLEDLLALIQDILDRPSFEVVTIHDEFKAHANHMNWVRRTYIEIFAELAESTVIDMILTAVKGEPYHLVKESENLGELIRQGNYSLS